VILQGLPARRADHRENDRISTYQSSVWCRRDTSVRRLRRALTIVRAPVVDNIELLNALMAWISMRRIAGDSIRYRGRYVWLRYPGYQIPAPDRWTRRPVSATKLLRGRAEGIRFPIFRSSAVFVREHREPVAGRSG